MMIFDFCDLKYTRSILIKTVCDWKMTYNKCIKQYTSIYDDTYKCVYVFDLLLKFTYLSILSYEDMLSWLCFYQTRSAWSMDQGWNKNHAPVNNFAPTVTKFCVMWEGQALPHDTKFGNCRGRIVDSRMFPSWSLIHGLSWSSLVKAEPGGHWWSYSPCALPLGSVIIIHLRIEFSKISARARSRNVLQYNNCKETEHIKQSESSAISHALVIFWTLLPPMLYTFVDLD